MKKMMIATLAAASVLLAVANQAHAGATLDAVQKKGFVQCGISDGLPGFSYADADGKFSGWICPYISRHLLSLNPLLACCRRYSRGER